MQQVAIYLRVSTDKQTSGLEAQERAISKYCEQKNIKYFQTFKDFNVSGTKASRPELDKLMDLARQKKISKIIVYSFSRFARSTTHLLKALDEFKTKGARRLCRHILFRLF